MASLAALAQETGKGLVLSGHGPPPRARVVVVQDAEATHAFKPDPEKVRALVARGLLAWTGRATEAEAWLSLLSTQDRVGLKVYSAASPNTGTRPVVVGAVIESLLSARAAPGHIIIWDRQLADLKQAGFVELAARYGVRVAGSVESGWDPSTNSYDSPLLGQLVYGDFEFNKKAETLARKSYLTKLLTTEITKIVNLTPLLNHNSAGVCGNLYSLALGSFDNVLRFEGDPARLAQAVPELYAKELLGDRVALNIVDALIAQYQGEQIGRLHYSTVLNQLRFSTDPVALDVLSIQELDKQRELKGLASHASTNALEIYRNASLLEIGISDPRQVQVERQGVSPHF